MADWFPVISQIKSLVQLVCGEKEEAEKTQINFLRQCPVISQTLALALLSLGCKKEAEKVFDEGISTISNVIDCVPLVGHAKGLCLKKKIYIFL